MGNTFQNFERLSTGQKFAVLGIGLVLKMLLCGGTTVTGDFALHLAGYLKDVSLGEAFLSGATGGGIWQIAASILLLTKGPQLARAESRHA